MVDFSAVAAQFAGAHRATLYADDPVLWAQDKCGDHIWSKQAEVLRSVATNKRTLVASCHASGKGGRGDMPLLTTDGWSTLDEVEVGQYVYSEYGKPVRVTAKKVWPARPHYRVIFSDGSSDVYDEAHDWVTIDMKERPRSIADWRDHWDAGTVKETGYLLRTLRTTTGQLNHRVPNALPLSGSGPAPDIDPWLLGYWLGNGTRGAGQLSIHSDDVEHVALRAADAGHPLLKVRQTSDNGASATPSQLRVTLREVGVLKRKRIPRAVQAAPVAFRVLVAQGLLDADGHASKSGHVSLDLCDKALADDVVELLRGLGVAVTARPRPAVLEGRSVGTRYRMSFTPVGWEPFLLERKAARVARRTPTSRPTCRTIAAVEYVGRGDTVCIEVDNPTHLYLSGRSLVPTHNSFLASRACAWWLDTHPKNPTETRVITTAPSWNQVKNVMWGYLESVKGVAGLGGRINGKAEWIFPGYTTPTAMGRKPADYDDSTFQGFHPTFPLVVIDEAGGVSETIFTSVETITTNAGARILAIANPDNPNSYMAKIWREQEALPPSQRAWNLIRISAFDTPNFTGENVPEKLQKNLLQHEWVEDAEKRWGTSDPRYQAKVLAVFPEIGEDGLFNLGRVLQSMNSYDSFDVDPEAPVKLGVDVGLSATGDFSVIAANQGGKVTILEKVKGLDGNQLARKIGECCDLYNVEEIRVDAVGVGRGVQAVLGNHVPENIPVHWIIGNEASPDKVKWYNFRAAMYDTVSQMINQGKLAIPPDEAQGEKTEGLFDEFRSILYEYRGTRLLIEGKDQIKRRGGHSPDVLDAIVYACLDLRALSGQGDETVTSDTLLAESDDLFTADEWGNEVWSFAPA